MRLSRRIGSIGVRHTTILQSTPNGVFFPLLCYYNASNRETVTPHKGLMFLSDYVLVSLTRSQAVSHTGEKSGAVASNDKVEDDEEADNERREGEAREMWIREANGRLWDQKAGDLGTRSIRLITKHCLPQ